jgi:acetylornithine/N-succinyldiaminopimelate aminotransferase
MTNWPELDNKYIMKTMNRIPLTIVRGEGTHVWDDAGREYLDFVAGLAVNCLGHCHPAIVSAITEQAGTLMQTSLWYHTMPKIKLAKLLVENSCFDKAFFCGSGAEANEGAIKLARRYGHLKLGGAYQIITTLDSFHGRTLMTTAATGQEKMHKPYLPLPADFRHVPFGDAEALRAATTDKVCAVLIEPVQGEGGVNVPDDSYFPAVRQWCDEKGILLILDEVQTGIGRLGELFGYQVFGIEPDIITLAKGLGGGMPIGAFLCNEKADVFSLGDHNATFGGNPLTTATAGAVLSYILENNIVEYGRRMGDYLRAGLEDLQGKHASVTEVRGRGLLLAMGLDSDTSMDIVMACLERGLLVNPVKPNAVRFMPPLTVTEGEIDQALKIVDGALTAAAAK